MEIIVAHDRRHGHVELGYGSPPSAIDYQPLLLPGMEVWRTCKSCPVAYAIPADKRHQELSIMPKNERAVGGVAVERAFLERRPNDDLAPLEGGFQEIHGRHKASKLVVSVLIREDRTVREPAAGAHAHAVRRTRSDISRLQDPEGPTADE